MHIVLHTLHPTEAQQQRAIRKTNCSNVPYKEEKQKCHHQPSNIWLSKALLAPCNFPCSIRPRCLIILKENLLGKCRMANMISYLINVVLMQVMEIKVLKASNFVHMQKLFAYQTLKEGDGYWKENNVASGRIEELSKRGRSEGKTANCLPSYTGYIQCVLQTAMGKWYGLKNKTTQQLWISSKSFFLNSDHVNKVTALPHKH